MILILNNDVIKCRKSDSYINATQLCEAESKLFGHQYRLASTKQLIYKLAKTINNNKKHNIMKVKNLKKCNNQIVI